MKKHKILDHPILGGFLIVFLAIMLMQFAGFSVTILKQMHFSTITLNVLSSVVEITLILIAWGIYRLFFKKEFKSLSNAEAFKKGCMLLIIPTLFFVVIDMKDAFSSELGNPLVALILGMAPGLFEEILFRGLFISNAMRTCKKYSTIVIVLVVSSLTFGAFHLLNVTQGAEIGATITQVLYALGTGMVFGAAYLRSGSLLPCIIAHSIIDACAFMSLSLQQSNGVLGEGGIEWMLVVAGIALTILGLYLIRPSKTNEILSVWQTKWIGNKAE